ncbi:unnamed protein product [Ceratitis capitata]|uniref:(Mediterranean fruit fly) hypothetical protein n=1 Tax=Ceratitis capitata TaxID=7213 RepID=A0A811UMR7_CERCA|nr:unnamed protein product [Ceratitis capitata]
MAQGTTQWVNSGGHGGGKRVSGYREIPAQRLLTTGRLSLICGMLATSKAVALASYQSHEKTTRISRAHDRMNNASRRLAGRCPARVPAQVSVLQNRCNFSGNTMVVVVLLF